MTSLGSIRWILLALLGLAVAAGVSLAASQLVSQRIGLAAEPVSAGKELAPPRHKSGNAPHSGAGGDVSGSTSTGTTTVPGTTSTVPPTAPPSSIPTQTTPSPSPTTPTGSGSEGRAA